MARPKDLEKPAQIIEAAFAVFGENGYGATRISHIADRAGISSGTIYTYFTDKKDLFRATVQEGWKRFLAQIDELSTSPLPTETRLTRFIEIGFEKLKSSLPLLRGMLFESTQMNLLQGNLDSLCSSFEHLIAQRRDSSSTPVDQESRRARIRLTVHGVLFAAALAEPGRIDEEVAALKRAILLMLKGG
jgi:AcrR family transcriptional regulator